MKQYEVVKIGSRHSINGEFFSQDVIEIYPLDDFVFIKETADELYKYIKSVDPKLNGVFPILEFEDGDYIGCVAVMAIVEKEGKEPQLILSVDLDTRNIADEYCRDRYYNPKTKVEQWSRLMQIADHNDLFEKIVDYVDVELRE